MSIAARPKMTRYIAETPTVKQQAFLLLDCHEALFGGAAGGGKSSALLMAALQYVDVPGYAALILRRTYADLALPGAVSRRGVRPSFRQDAPRRGHLRQDGRRRWPGVVGSAVLSRLYGRLAASSSFSVASAGG